MRYVIQYPKVLKVSADFKTETETGGFSAFVERAKNPKLTGDELKRYANEFPEVKVVLEDALNYHQGITDEFQSVTDDLEDGSADKPTSIERVKAQSEKFKAESLSNIEASTERLIALIEGLDADQQQRAADYWAESFSVFAAAWSEILTETEGSLRLPSSGPARPGSR